MCGIVGFMDRTGAAAAPVGRHLLEMLAALGRRGPDSAGVAIFGRVPAKAGDDHRLVLRVKLGERGDAASAAAELLQQAAAVARVCAHSLTGSYLRLEVDESADVRMLMEVLEGQTPHPAQSAEVISMGHRLEIVKQVGTPENLEATYAVSRAVGTHGIGHTRLSTESRVDLSHSQPFWARGLLDVATVHNGHITNYHQLRRRYEQRGVRFCTENDSEVIGVYLRDRMSRGDSLEEALHASLADLDGSFCTLVATGDALAFVKDPFSLKPLVMAETPGWVAIATEELALRRALGNGFEAREPAARAMQVWHVAKDEG
jgi:glutamate synthase domain-containing protein 1